jgi:AraC-like DNA-binding protein
MDAAQRFLECLHEVLGQNYGRRDFDLGRMADAMKISKRHLQRKVSQLVGCGPARYLRMYRLHKALDYLRASTPVGEVAHAVGFSSHAYFTHCFRAQFGTTPTDFQTRHRRGVAILSPVR